MSTKKTYLVLAINEDGCITEEYPEVFTDLSKAQEHALTSARNYGEGANFHVVEVLSHTEPVNPTFHLVKGFA